MNKSGKIQFCKVYQKYPANLLKKCRIPPFVSYDFSDDDNIEIE